MPDLSYDSLALVMGVAFVAPLLLAFVPRLPIPAVVLEIVLGIVIGPQVLGWARADDAVRVLGVIGLAFLLFLSGLEVDIDRLQGRVLGLAALSYAVSLGLALGAGFALDAAGIVKSPLLAAVVLSATSLGLVIPALVEADRSESSIGQLVIVAASIGNLASALLLSLLFSSDANDTGTRVILLGGFALAVVVLVFGLTRRLASMEIGRLLTRFDDTTAQLRVRGSLLLLMLLVVAAEQFGLAAILGAFVAGAVLRAVDPDAIRTHPQFHVKLEAIGYGFLIPIFFIASGLQFDLNSLLDEPSVLVRVPVFLAALLLVRGMPAILYRAYAGNRGAFAAGLLQATSLPFIVAATQIGIAIDAITPATAAAFVAAGLLSALMFPAAAVALLGRDDAARRAAGESDGQSASSTD